jgi:cysteine desulfurase/selenocysteine lyase
MGLTASVRASTAVYNTADEIDVFLDAVSGVRGFFGVGS